MVKIRLRRIGSKGRPFYRVVVAPSTAGRNGKFVETLGTYDPLVKPTAIKINEERALHWLMNGAQPTETTAYLLNKVGVLERLFEERPHLRKEYGFLDKRTAAISVDKTTAPRAAEEKAAKTEETPASEESAEPTDSAEAEVEVEAEAEAPAAESDEAVTEEEAPESPVMESPEAEEVPEEGKE